LEGKPCRGENATLHGKDIGNKQDYTGLEG